MSANLQFFGGVNEIGGNKILVEHDKTRLFLDFGTSMGYESDFFSEFLKARTNTELRDKLVLGALPKIDGVYRRDYFVPRNSEALSNDSYKRIVTLDSEYLNIEEIVTCEDYHKKNGKMYVDAILLSHAHLDHSGAIGYLHPSIPLFCSTTSEILLYAIDEITSFPSNAIISNSYNIDKYTGTSFFPSSPKLSKENITRKCCSLNDNQTLNIGSFDVKHISQDHSVPGSSSFVLNYNGKKLLYTGDIRFHGYFPMTIDQYCEKVGTNIDIMICEGTRINSDSILTESKIVDNITSKIMGVKGIVFIDFSWKDTTRYETILQACKASGRIFVINARLAYLLNKLGKQPDEKFVKVFLKRRNSCLYLPADYNKNQYEFGLNTKWKENGIESSHYENGLTASDIKKHPDKYVMMLSYFDLNQIFDIADENGQIPNSFMIKAQCAPFCDEMELDEERFIHWLDTFGIGYELDKSHVPDGCANPDCSKIKKVMKRDHVSGHVSRNEISELVGKIKPGKVIPIHTQYPDEFVKIVDKIGKGIEVILPRVGEIYAL
jgi:ribonuclease J